VRCADEENVNFKATVLYLHHCVVNLSIPSLGGEIMRRDITRGHICRFAGHGVMEYMQIIAISS